MLTKTVDCINYSDLTEAYKSYFINENKFNSKFLKKHFRTQNFLKATPLE